MKKLAIAVLAFACASCLSYKELPVEYDYSYSGDFRRYRTFDIMKPSIASDSTMDNEVIEKFVLSRMKFLGYKKSTTRPHLIISYKVFTDSLRLKGYIQPEMEKWLKTPNEYTYDAHKYNLKTGTLLIQFYDRRQSKSVWQGYSTMLYGGIDYNSKRQLRNAVISILDKYRVWADGFIEQQGKNLEIVNP